MNISVSNLSFKKQIFYSISVLLLLVFTTFAFTVSWVFETAEVESIETRLQTELELAEHLYQQGIYRLHRQQADIWIGPENFDDVPKALLTAKPGIHDEIALDDETDVGVRVSQTQDGKLKVIVAVAEDASWEWAEESLDVLTWVYAGFFLFLLLIVVRTMAAWLSRPIYRLHDMVVEHNGRALPLGDIHPDLRPVVKALNETFSSLDDAIARERELTDLAAHELRTPLAQINARVDVMMLEKLPTEVSQACIDIKAIVATVSENMNAMLTLARGHAVEQVFDVSVAISDAVSRAPIGNNSASYVEYVGGEEQTLEGPYSLFQIVLDNLLRNALEYGVGGRVKVTLRPASVLIENPISDKSSFADNAASQIDYSSQNGTDRGFGLYIVRLICERTGWEMAKWVEADMAFVEFRFAEYGAGK